DPRPPTSHAATAATAIPDPERLRQPPCPTGGFGLAKYASARCARSAPNNPPSQSSSATYDAPHPIPSRSPRPACRLPRLRQSALGPPFLQAQQRHRAARSGGAERSGAQLDPAVLGKTHENRLLDYFPTRPISTP